MDSSLTRIRRSPRAKSAYERFIASEGVPVVGGLGVNAIGAVRMLPWGRLGCRGAYFQFLGSDGVIGMYAGSLAPGGATLPERHLYEKIIYILEGEGVAEIQQRDQVPQNLLWRTGSLFSPPMNTLHRLMNLSDQPALFLAVTTAPVALDHYRNDKFVFHSDFIFSDRYDGEADYLLPNQERFQVVNHRESVHQANFIEDVRAMGQGGVNGNAGRVTITRFEIANNCLGAQFVEWPVGRYRKAHCRSGGVALLILRSSGYSLMWPSHLGTHPYKNGLAHKVVRFDWTPGSLFSPPPNWFHQHFNTGAEPAQTLAFFCGSEQFPMTRRTDGANAAAPQVGAPVDLNGDDPSIRRMYEAELVKKGIAPDKNLVIVAKDD